MSKPVDLDAIRENAIAIVEATSPGVISALEPVDASGSVEELSPVRDEEVENYLMAGIGKGAPGEEVNIDIVGRTAVPVLGFGMYLGCPKEVRLVSGRVSPELSRLIGIEDPEDVVAQSRGDGTEAFLSIMVAFFGQITGRTRDRLEEIKHVFPLGVPIPDKTPLVNLRLRIPENALPGQTITLDNRSWVYGKKVRNAQGRSRTLRMSNEYGAHKEINRGRGLEPTLISGFIKVV